MRPLLDGMQTIPAFVYLVPVVMLFGIGNVPGVIVTVIFAIAPLIRLTNLGIRQVPEEVVEATGAFGATDRQLLWKAQVPLALPTIMAGVNQTLMMSLSMVVIASMISVGGLGQMVLRGIGRLDVGLAAVGGLGIVMLAVVLDRLTQALCTPKRRLYDPCNIRYALDSSSMQVWTLHNATRYALILNGGPAILFDFAGCEHLAAGLGGVDESASRNPSSTTRPALLARPRPKASPPRSPRSCASTAAATGGSRSTRSSLSASMRSGPRA